MRPIDADALLENLPDLQSPGELVYRNAAITSIADVIKVAPTIIPAPRWIPVEEQLPEKDGYVLVYRQNHPGCSWDLLYWYGGGWAASNQTAKSVTHWMPLPEPPKEATP